MCRRITVFLLSLVFLAGCLITLLPVINEQLYREKMKTTVSEFQSNTEHQPPVVILPSGDAEATEYTPAIHQELWNDIQQYNSRLFQSRQEGINGLESLEEAQQEDTEVESAWEQEYLRGLYIAIAIVLILFLICIVVALLGRNKDA